MSESEMQNILLETTRALLEQAAFLFAEQAEQPAEFSGPMSASTLRFTGGGNGKLMLIVTPKRGTALAADLLGLDPDAPEASEKSHDALGEMLNMLTGMLSDAWPQTSEPWEIGTPKTGLLTVGELVAAKAAFSIKASLVTEDGDPIEVWLSPGG